MKQLSGSKPQEEGFYNRTKYLYPSKCILQSQYIGLFGIDGPVYVCCAVPSHGSKGSCWPFAHAGACRAELEGRISEVEDVIEAGEPAGWYTVRAATLANVLRVDFP